MDSTTSTTDHSITVHLSPDELVDALRQEVEQGLGSAPMELSPKFLYDDRGCELFDQITRLEEYYPTRAERTILEQHAGEIVGSAGADTLIELGSGTSDKTRLLIEAMRDADSLDRFVAFDVAEATLRDAVAKLSAEHPTVEVQGVVGDFNVHLGELPRGGTRMVAFLGGTIGNLHPHERSGFLDSLAATFEPGDSLLLGTDLVKDRDRLVAAYDDRQGVTAEFNRNVLSVINRELGGDFDTAGFEHVARFDEEGSFIEMRLRAVGEHSVRIDDLDMDLRFTDGDEVRTEISTKFAPDRVRDELRSAGLEPVGVWTDPAGDYALWLAER